MCPDETFLDQNWTAVYLVTPPLTQRVVFKGLSHKERKLYGLVLFCR